MSRTIIIIAGLLLGASSVVSAQNATQPANVVTPAPPPREGTVGPEQLRDFSLPGTRQPAPPPAAEAPRPAAPAPAARPPAARPAPATANQAEPRAEPPPPPAAREAAAPPAVERPAPDFLPAPSISGGEAQQPAPQAAQPLPPITVTQPPARSEAMLPNWWPWLLVAALCGVGLALALRQRRRLAPAAHREAPVERFVADPPAPTPTPTPAPAPRAAVPLGPMPEPAEAPLPSGLVTTRLRQPAAAPVPAAPAPPPVSGGVVSRRLRGWIEVDLAIREVLFDEQQAVIRFDLIVANGGTAAARELAIEAFATNAGEDQGRELATFFARPAPATIGIAELGPLGDMVLSHELRMPRSAIRAYEAQGRTLFVPLIGINVGYRTASLEARTSAAFLAGREVAGSEKLAPLLLPAGAGRQLGLGVRRLEEAVRR